MNYPIVKTKILYHWGTMDKDLINKNGFSYEGNSLSVSTCPEDWCKLLTLTEKDKLFTLNKRDSVFVDILSILNDNKYKDLKRLLIKTAFDNGFLESKIVHKYIFDDEGQISYMIFDNKEDALYELSDCEDTDCIHEIEMNVGTEKLTNEINIGKDLALLSGEEYGIIAMLKKDINIDGIFWNYNHNIFSYSLPLYCIFSNKVSEWNVNLTKV